MAELRKHPLTNDWIMIASHRQGRPQMPKDYCPFCPGSGKVPEDYRRAEIRQRLSRPVPQLRRSRTTWPPAFSRRPPAYGKCEVILYSPGAHHHPARAAYRPY